MRATVMYGTGDVHPIEATGALVVVRRAAICGSGLWPYKKKALIEF